MNITQPFSRYTDILEAFKANEIKESITSPNLSSCEFWRIANSVLSKDKPSISSLFYYPEVLSCASDKAKMFSKNSNLDNSDIFLPVFHSLTYIKLHGIHVAAKLLEKVIANLDFFSEPELSYMLAELFNMCLKQSHFPDFFKVLSMVPAFKNVRENN